jgi:L-fuconolactonase
MLAASPFLNMSGQTEAIPIIDTHIHLFDPRRPQGVPWPPKDDKVLYQPALPGRYREVTRGLGIVGAIEVECSPWLEDNQWVLDVASKDPIIVGSVGDLDPAHPDFPKHLDRFHRNPLFRGIRYGNLWGRNLGAELSRPEFISNLKLLVDAGLELDTANPDPDLISAVVQLTDEIPGLRVVIDHLPELEIPTDPKGHRTLDANLKELGERPQVYAKVSEVVRPIQGHVHYDLNFYRNTLDGLWDTFGEDRLIYGSDWPNSDNSAPFTRELTVVREYFMGKGRAAAEKYFWKNSVAAYHWVKRDPSQPS